MTPDREVPHITRRKTVNQVQQTVPTTPDTTSMMVALDFEDCRRTTSRTFSDPNSSPKSNRWNTTLSSTSTREASDDYMTLHLAAARPREEEEDAPANLS